jgi:hypothetical protein
MGFRFRRSIGIIPGVRLNFGRRGTSVSLGVRGAHMTVGPTGVRKTVGIPGTGMSYTTHDSWGTRRTPTSVQSEPQSFTPQQAQGTSSGNAGWVVAGILLVLLLVVVASS